MQDGSASSQRLFAGSQHAAWLFVDAPATICCEAIQACD
jgi:hypothetical protein